MAIKISSQMGLTLDRIRATDVIVGNGHGGVKQTPHLVVQDHLAFTLRVITRLIGNLSRSPSMERRSDSMTSRSTLMGALAI